MAGTRAGCCLVPLRPVGRQDAVLAPQGRDVQRKGRRQGADDSAPEVRRVAVRPEERPEGQRRNREPRADGRERDGYEGACDREMRRHLAVQRYLDNRRDGRQGEERKRDPSSRRRSLHEVSEPGHQPASERALPPANTGRGNRAWAGRRQDGDSLASTRAAASMLMSVQKNPASKSRPMSSNTLRACHRAVIHRCQGRVAQAA